MKNGSKISVQSSDLGDNHDPSGFKNGSGQCSSIVW